jgi:hypothetical protein
MRQGMGEARTSRQAAEPIRRREVHGHARHYARPGVRRFAVARTFAAWRFARTRPPK